jgi:hypothetical protein
MIRTALLACALLALPSVALAQTRIIQPEVRVMNPPDSIRLGSRPANDEPPEHHRDMAIDEQGWIYHEIGGWTHLNDTTPVGASTVYQGPGYPATIMVCPAGAPIRLLPRDQPAYVVPNGRCATVTTEYLQLIGIGYEPGIRRVRYRILAIHRAAD